MKWEAAARATEKAQVRFLTDEWKTWYNYAYYRVRLSHYFAGLDRAAPSPHSLP